eukprot:6642082-Prymnesium_polylepis.2
MSIGMQNCDMAPRRRQREQQPFQASRCSRRPPPIKARGKFPSAHHVGLGFARSLSAAALYSGAERRNLECAAPSLHDYATSPGSRPAASAEAARRPPV